MKKRQPDKKHDLEAALPGFETIADARRESEKRQKILQRYSETGLAEKMNGCSRKHPCGSFACSVCTRKYRKEIFPELVELCDLYEEGHTVTIVIYDDRLVMADGKISLFEFVLQHVLLKHLERHIFRTKPPRVRHQSFSAVFPDVVNLVSPRT